MNFLQKENKEKEETDEFQEKYRKRFGVKDKYLIGMEWDPKIDDDNGYIVVIDYQNDLDFTDCRKLDEETTRQRNRWIAKLQRAEAEQCKHLPEAQQMDFKRMLGVGYMHALSGNFDDIEDVIIDALAYLKKRNKEHSRQLFLCSGLPIAVLAAVLGLILYFVVYRNPWVYGMLFGILGAFVSIWTRYGKVQFTGHARIRLHTLECFSRILIGAIFAVVAMVAIDCKLILPDIAESSRLYAFIIASFIAAFSERFIPSIVERITKDNK